MPHRTRFSTLTERQCRALVRRHSNGRIAFTYNNLIDIEPIGYLLHGKWLYARTSAGSKLALLKHSPWVAFQVDEVEGLFNWASVVIHGTVYFLIRNGDAHEHFPRALRLMRARDRRILTPDDPTPHRTILFRIHINKITGRRAVTRSADA